MFKNIEDADLIAEFDRNAAQFHVFTQQATYNITGAYAAADNCYRAAQQPANGNIGRNWNAEMDTWLKNRSWASSAAVANAR